MLGPRRAVTALDGRAAASQHQPSCRPVRATDISAREDTIKLAKHAVVSEMSGLLNSAEPAAFEVLDVEPTYPTLLVCDHASNRIPLALNNLGLDDAQRDMHIAVDIGAGAVTRQLSQRLGIPAVLASYSRLVVDCNRRLDDPTAFPASVDGIEIPANIGISDTERQRRADALYWPYHHAIRDRLAGLERIKPAPAVIAIHSFTPALASEQRPWHFGILWDKDPRIPQRVLDGLRAVPGVHVGDNQPYSGRHPSDFTIDHHAEAEGLPHVGIELRQDLLRSAKDVERWSDILTECLAPILRDEALYTNWSGPHLP